MLFKRKKQRESTACAVIVAAGSSQRMGGGNKLLLEIAGAPVLAHTLLAFERCTAIASVVLVCREQDIVPYSELVRTYGAHKVCTITRGGESRTASVLAGVRACPEGTALIAVHDGARPLVPETVIAQAVQAAAACGAAAPVVPLKDSIKRIADGNIAADVPRERIAAVQTPQVFRKELLERALTTAARENRVFTDDCAAVEALGVPVRATEGSYHNLKITTSEDVLVAQALLQGEQI